MYFVSEQLAHQYLVMRIQIHSRTCLAIFATSKAAVAAISAIKLAKIGWHHSVRDMQHIGILPVIVVSYIAIWFTHT
jgi:hypothetical protein